MLWDIFSGYQLSIVQALQYYRILLLISVPGFLYSILLFAQVTNPKVDLRCIHRYVDVRQKALKHMKILYIDWCERMNDACCVKRIECSGRIQKHYITGIPFTIATPLWPKCILLLQSHQISVQLRCAAHKSVCMMLSCQYGPNIWEVCKHPVESMPWAIKAVLKNKEIPASTSKVYPLKCTHVIAAVLKLQVGGISHQQNILAMTFKKQGNQSHWVCPIFQ